MSARKVAALLLSMLLLSGCAATYPNGYLVRIDATPQPVDQFAQEETAGYVSSRYYSRLVAGVNQQDGVHDVLCWRDDNALLCINSPVRTADELPYGETLYRVDFATGFTEKKVWPGALAQRSFEVYDAAPCGDKLLLMCYGSSGEKNVTAVALSAQRAADIQALPEGTQMLAHGWAADGGWTGLITQTDKETPVLQLYAHATGRQSSFSLAPLAKQAGTAQPYYMARGNVLQVSADGSAVALLLKNGKFVQYSLAEENVTVLWDFGKDKPHAFQLLQNGSLIYADEAGIHWVQPGEEEPYLITTDAALFRVSDDGRQIAYLKNDGEGIYDLYVGVLYNNSVYERYRVYNGIGTGYNHMRWSDDGEKLLISYNSRGPKEESMADQQPYVVFDFS